MSDAQTVDAVDFAILRGRKLFRDRAPSPEYPGEDNWGPNDPSALWLGYHAERMTEALRRHRTMEILGVGDAYLP